MRTTLFLIALFLPAAAVFPTDAAVQEESHATDDAHGAAEGEHAEGAENPIDLKLDLGLWTLIVFFVLLAVLARFAWRPLAESLDAREKYIHDSLAEAERAREEAKRLLAEHDRRLADVQNEVRAVLDEARRDAQHTQQEILRQAQEEAQNIRERAKREIGQARDEALKDLFERSAILATEIASRIVQRNLSPQDQRALAEQVLNQLPANGKH